MRLTECVRFRRALRRWGRRWQIAESVGHQRQRSEVTWTLSGVVPMLQ